MSKGYERLGILRLPVGTTGSFTVGKDGEIRVNLGLRDANELTIEVTKIPEDPFRFWKMETRGVHVNDLIWTLKFIKPEIAYIESGGRFITFEAKRTIHMATRYITEISREEYYNSVIDASLGPKAGDHRILNIRDAA